MSISSIHIISYFLLQRFFKNNVRHQRNAAACGLTLFAFSNILSVVIAVMSWCEYRRVISMERLWDSVCRRRNSSSGVQQAKDEEPPGWLPLNAPSEKEWPPRVNQ